MNMDMKTELKSIIDGAEFVLSSSERNEYGDWIGSEHALLRWSNSIRAFTKGLDDYPNCAEINELLEPGMTHPNEVKKMKKLLEELKRFLDYKDKRIRKGKDGL